MTPPTSPGADSTAAVNIHALLRQYIDAGIAVGHAEAAAGENAEADPAVDSAYEKCCNLRTDIGLYIVGLEDANAALRAALLRSQQERDALATALRECADDLEAELRARYGDSEGVHPTQHRRFDRDMEPVRTARRLLNPNPTPSHE